MNKTQSRDGTSIAYDRQGSGPPLILVDGAFGSRTMGPNGALAQLLASEFTVFTYDRRGRGGSGPAEDADDLAVTREVEDIEALVAVAGGSASLYGISSGAALALEAAVRLQDIDAVVLYEAPFVVDATREAVPDDYYERLTQLLSEGRRGSAVGLFMRVGVGLPAIVVALMRLMPAWRKMKAVAHTLRYDTLLTVDNQRGRPLPARRWSAVTQPTLVVSGGKSPEWMRNGMAALAETLPNAAHRTLAGQTHLVKAKTLAPTVSEFLSSRSGGRRAVVPIGVPA